MSTDDRTPNPTDFVEVNGVQFTHDDLFRVVDEFYTRVQRDELLSVPFRSVHDWPEHIRRLTHFWWIKFGGPVYMWAEYNPPQKHFFAGFNNVLLERWLSLFHTVLEEQLSAEQAALWRVISIRMGQGLSAKNEMLKKHYAGQGRE